MTVKIFTYTGSLQSITLPKSITQVYLQAWGGAGGPPVGFTSYGGAGGYSSGYLPVHPSANLTIMVGEVGKVEDISTTFGGGGAGGKVASGPYHGASGGGRSGVSLSSTLPQVIIAGGGGGAGVGSTSSLNTGGNGGGLVGNTTSVINGGRLVIPATGGNQSTGGIGASVPSISTPNINGKNGASLLGGSGGAGPGGSGSGGGGGGGGGYFGGGGGNASTDNGDNPAEMAGGGGSGYLDSLLINGISLSAPQSSVGGISLPPNTTDPNYITGVGVANGNKGTGNGLVAVTFAEIVLTKSVDKIFVAPGGTVTYTIEIFNTGPGDLIDVRFIDTIPTGSTLISVSQDGTTLTGPLSDPGVTLPNPIIDGGISTVTFSVLASTTITSPLINTAMASIDYPNYTYLSNTVTVPILSVSTSKAVDKTFASLGETLTYSILLSNSSSSSLTSINFLDTLPFGTTFVPNSLYQDGTLISGSPNPPGVILPNNILPGGESTITFQVITVTVPPDVLYVNDATFTFATSISNISFISSIVTNSVTTNIGSINLDKVLKSVDKLVARCGDTITYTISSTNTGTLTAKAVKFIDTIPNRLAFVFGSVIINGVNQSSYTPNIPMTIPDLAPGDSFTISFRCVVTCQ